MPTNESINRAVYRMTEWISPQELIRTNASVMRADRWLQSEVDRLANKWTEAWVQVHRETGELALYTWSGEQLPVDDSDNDKY
jgi:hypothetical protein